MDSAEESSETNLVIINKRYRLKLFLKLYWRTMLVISIPIVLIPVALLDDKDSHAYKCFYVFLLTSCFWIADVMHPVVVAMVPVAMYTLMGNISDSFFQEMYVRNNVLNALGTMMLVIAIEECQISRRLALITLQRLGCSHYRLSFLLFFISMFISMWVSNSLACGLMMPVVKAILKELERMGILEMYYSDDKATQQSSKREQRSPKPTDFTIFYFVGLTFSSTLGGVATLSGSNCNQLFKWYFELFFPLGPKLEFPHFMLLNLPAVLLMESLLYVWLNFFFMGMFRSKSDIALQIGMSEEEAAYVQTLLSNQRRQMGRITFHECVVGIIAVVNFVFDAFSSVTFRHGNVSSPTIACVILLFIMPTNLEFLKFLKRRRRSSTSVSPLPRKSTRACLSWELVRDKMLWGVLFIIGSSCSLFDSLTASRMTDEFDKYLLSFRNWPPSAVAFVVIIYAKILTEFAPNNCVAFTLMPGVARMSVLAEINPIYLMSAATIGASLPFSLITGSPGNAMVVAYVRMPHYKMMLAGLGPTLFSIVITWTTVTLWSTTIFPDIASYPGWAKKNVVFFNMTDM